MLLPFCALLVIGLVGYVAFASLWVRYIFAHIGGLGVLGLLACWTGAIAKKKGRSYWRAFSLGLMIPVMLGVSSVGVVHILGGHGCGGIVSLFAAAAVIVFYSLANKSALKTKSTGATSSYGSSKKPKGNGESR